MADDNTIFYSYKEELRIVRWKSRKNFKFFVQLN